MSTTIPVQTPAEPAAPAHAVPAHRSTAPARTIRPIPMTRLAKVELRKMFDTRAGFWLMASVGIVAVLATAAVILWAPDSAIDQETFSSAIGFPLSVILPIIGLLSVTSEYSQRTGLTTYTLVPWRGRVITAKMLVTLAIGVASMFLALAVGAVGNLVGSAITGLDPVWNVSVGEFGQIVLANVLGMLIGFTLGVLMRSSAAAIVGYFIYSLVLPAALGALAAFQEWFRDLQPWVDINFATTRLFEDTMTAENWQQLGVTTLVWLWIPLALGLRAVLRAEVK
ncbi:ABC transporter permease subunit [Nocardioides sp. zg-1308]|jgi:ABC-2 type transport system permease protein|uniref:ABC transporter permease n=1 Tax=Nocardioides TaxID=1839 RepID=UPI001555817D|nr:MULTISPECIES: ABC transporter permease [unclassified Nocardioides]NPD04056.1 ABC transporter permease subunit [Nocardioides sp. zg-1308]WQQ21931.1 ABC transporter permease subunit [Nocardioides sp. S-34]